MSSGGKKLTFPPASTERGARRANLKNESFKGPSKPTASEPTVFFKAQDINGSIKPTVSLKAQDFNGTTRPTDSFKAQDINGSIKSTVFSKTEDFNGSVKPAVFLKAQDFNKVQPRPIEWGAVQPDEGQKAPKRCNGTCSSLNPY